MKFSNLIHADFTFDSLTSNFLSVSNPEESLMTSLPVKVADSVRSLSLETVWTLIEKYYAA